MSSQFPLGHNQSQVRDNRDRGSVGQFLKDQITPDAELSFVSAYFTIYAFNALKDSLKSAKQLRFLFGEPRFIKNVRDASEHRTFTLRRATDDTPTSLILSEECIDPKQSLAQRQIAQECADWIRDRVEIRSVIQSNLLHGKLYYIQPPTRQAAAIVGSANFTSRGLGLSGDASNIELNLIASDDRDRAELKRWFDEIWDDTDLIKDVKDDVLTYLAQIHQDTSPEFVYFKTLYHLFGTLLKRQDDNAIVQQKRLEDSQIWHTLYEFQKQGVTSIIDKLLTHNGCILADSVGLGKTYEALAVIKYFQERNDRILVLCPKKLRRNWTTYLDTTNSSLNPLADDRFNYTVLSHTDLSRTKGKSGDINLETFRWNAFDLVVIDESHNFRNDKRGKTDRHAAYKPSRYERLMDDILKDGIKTKVLLLSATPVNNDLRDLQNQIKLITGDNAAGFADSLNIANVDRTFSTAKKRFTEWAKQTKRDRRDLMTRLNADFFQLLDGLTIARSRKHIERYYADTISELGGFPTRLTPISITSEIDRDDSFMDYDKLYREISEYQLSLFYPANYVLPEFTHLYEGDVIQNNFTQGNREAYLIAMMRMNLLKRLESSVYSFQLTLDRTIKKIKYLEQKIHDFEKRPDRDTIESQIELDPNTDETLDDETLDDETRAALEVGGSFKYQLAHLDLDRWKQDLKCDRQQFNTVYLHAKDVSPDRDAKLDRLKRLIQDKHDNPTLNKDGQENRKVLIFTAFGDTAAYLYDKLHDQVYTDLGLHIAMVRGSGKNATTYGKTNFEEILIHFAPRAKQRDAIASLPNEAEIDILIATDCISEGQNLQDCDYLVNYDIHWNPVRIVQRFGRVDRIGSRNAAVQLVNFWPTDDLDGYINLKNRVEARMALVDLSATAEDNMLDVAVQQSEIVDELTYRDRQLKRLQTEAIDLDDSDDSISLTEFSLEDFRLELLRFLETHQHDLEIAPLGLFAVVPPSEHTATIEPGALFCFAQVRSDTPTSRKPDPTENQRFNPLQPYFLVYVTDSGEVKASFTQPKRILELWQQLCAGKRDAYETLCREFDRRTDNGADMSHYADLVETALQNIQQVYTKRIKRGAFQSGKQGGLTKRSARIDTDTRFELVTWLAIFA
jgi:Helicase conserved C-terminal domain/PLD-like domain/SNF2-related domain